MRPLRALLPVLRRQSPVALAREAAWRGWKPYRTARLLSMIRRGETRLRFRDLPYYRPDLQALKNETPVIAAYADQICQGNFPFLGYDTVHLGTSPRWNIDFVSGFEWENLPAGRLHPVVRHNGSDVKVPWELSRLQYLPVLAKAHLLTSEPRYREAVKAIFSDWYAKNPVGVGVNWTLAMESALRGMSLCFLLNLLQPLRPDEQEWAEQVTLSIWQHMLYTESCIEFSHLIRSNHYLSNIVGLHCMATFLDGPGIERRRKEYRRRVQQEMLRQVYEDGGDYEASFSYHLLVLQMFTNAFLLMQADRHLPTEAFTSRLRAMFQYLAVLADAHGRVPHVGDSDDGRVELLTSDLRQMLNLPREERDSLIVPGYVGLGDALFGLGCGGDAAEYAWYGLTQEGKTRARERVTVFPRSGVAVLRSEDAQAIFCAIPNGIGGGGSHTHNDKLSIVLRVRGYELLCDSGTYGYTRDTRLRNLFRSTAAHNTVAIDNEEQNEINPSPGFAFCVSDQAKMKPIEVTQAADEIRASSSHSGYNRLGVEHRRVLRMLSSGIVIEDALIGAGEHAFEVFWHLAAGWRVKQEAGCEFHICGPLSLKLKVESGIPLSCSHELVDISRSYGGATQKGVRLKAAGNGDFPCTVTTSISW